MSWFSVLKDGDFVFDTDNQSRAGFYDPNLKESFVNLSADALKNFHDNEDKLIDKIVSYMSHENAHQAFDKQSEQEMEKHQRKLVDLMSDSYVYHLQEQMRIDTGNTSTPINSKYDSDKLDELREAVHLEMSYQILDEIYAGLAEGQQGLSRVLMEGYTTKLAEQLKDNLIRQIEMYSKFWKENLLDMPLPIENKNLFIRRTVDTTNIVMNMIVNHLYEISRDRAATDLLAGINVEISGKEEDDLSNYEKVLFALRKIKKTDLLLEYFKTGDFETIRPALEQAQKMGIVNFGRKKE